MHKIFCVLLSAALVLSGSAWCDTPNTTTTATNEKNAKKCLFPKSRKRAPLWVCDAHADGLTVAAVGSSAKSKAGLSFMEQQAAADARVHLAQNLHGSRQRKIAGSDGASTTLITNASLQGTKILKSAYGPDGTLYVLLGLDEANAKKLRESLTSTRVK